MARDERLLRLSREHHHGLVLALRIQRELPGADDRDVGSLSGDLLRYWSAALLPHCDVEDEGFLARLAALGDDGLAFAGRMQREHRELLSIVETLRTERDTGRRRGALARFGDTLATHIRWEERELLDRVQEWFSAEDLDAAGALITAKLPAVPLPAPTAQSL
jgi:hemerythrin-like domain-containing protein